VTAGVPEGSIGPDDPRAADVRQLIARHLAFVRPQSPPEDVHALDVGALTEAGVEFFSFRRDGMLLAIGALKRLDARHGEIKSMHTAELARRAGIGRAMVEYLVGVARQRGYRRVSLETGSTEGFDAARALYAGLGFEECGPFGDYVESAYSSFMTIELPPGDHRPAGT
jgi:putative acetyltransferase